MSSHLNFQQIVDAVKQLSFDEKLQLNEIIWNEPLDIPLEHQALVLKRLDDIQKNPDSLLDWEEASQALKP